MSVSWVAAAAPHPCNKKPASSCRSQSAKQPDNRAMPHSSMQPGAHMAAHQATQAVELSKKQYSVAVCLAFIFGILGVHHFYLKRWGEAALDVGLTVTAVLLWPSHPLIALAVFFLDLLHTVVVTSLLLVGKWRDGDGRLLAYPGQFPALEQQNEKYPI